MVAQVVTFYSSMCPHVNVFACCQFVFGSFSLPKKITSTLSSRNCSKYQYSAGLTSLIPCFYGQRVDCMAALSIEDKKNIALRRLPAFGSDSCVNLQIIDTNHELSFCALVD